MLSFVGLSTAERRKLTHRAERLEGTCIITVHKAQHLKLSSLTGDTSDPYCTIAIGNEKFQTLACRGGGIHPYWNQQFIFHLPGQKPVTASQPLTPTKPKSPSKRVGAKKSLLSVPSTTCTTVPFDGMLHLVVLDDSRGRGEIVGRADINLVQLFANGGDAQWVSLIGSKPHVEHGFICISAEFNGTGLEDTIKTEAGGEMIILDDSTPSPASSSFNAGATAPLHTDNVTPSPSSSSFSFSSTSGSLPTLTSPLSTAIPPTPSIILIHPNPISPHPIADPCDPNSAFWRAPRDTFPVPSSKPPAPGYPVSNELPSPSRPSSAAAAGGSLLARPGTSSGIRIRPDTSTASRPSTSTSTRPSTSFSATTRPSTSSVTTTPTEAIAEELVTVFDTHHPHLLQLVASVPRGRFLCSTCRGEGHTTAYVCTTGCAFQIHAHCLAEVDPDSQPSHHRPDMRRDERHVHPLTWKETIYDGSYVCTGCGGGGTGPVWHCDSCNQYDMHPGCMR